MPFSLSTSATDGIILLVLLLFAEGSCAESVCMRAKLPSVWWEVVECLLWKCNYQGDIARTNLRNVIRGHV